MRPLEGAQKFFNGVFSQTQLRVLTFSPIKECMGFANAPFYNAITLHAQLKRNWFQGGTKRIVLSARLL